MNRAYDVAVVGAGVNGSSIAYHLARRGVRVGVFDRAEPAVEPSASWASAGGVRQQGRDPREWGLSIEASRRWPGLAEELGADLGYAQGGHLHLAENEADLALLRERVARERAAGMTSRLVEGAELREIAPGITPTALAGAHTPNDGQANPPQTTRAWAAAARRLGAEYRTGTLVERLVLEGGRVVGLVAGGERVSAGTVVVAAGAWTNRLVATAGLAVPLRPRAPQMLLTEAATPQLKPTITGYGRQLSLKQLPTGEYFIGGGWPSDVFETPDGGLGCRTREESIAGSWAVATAVVPAVARQRIVRAWCGIEAQCFDGVPLIGPAPGLPGLYLAAGFSGHGFQISPAVGRAVADALDGQTVPELAGLDPARMLHFDPNEVATFLAEATGEMEVGTLG